MSTGLEWIERTKQMPDWWLRLTFAKAVSDAVNGRFLIDSEALEHSVEAFAKYIKRKPIGKAVEHVQAIYQDERQAAAAAVILMRSEQFLHKLNELKIPDWFEWKPEFVVIWGGFVKGRMQREMAMASKKMDYSLQVCFDWACFLYKASKPAGCARCIGMSGRIITVEAYKKTVKRLGLRFPKSPEITLENVLEFDDRTKPYLAAIRKQGDEGE